MGDLIFRNYRDQNQELQRKAIEIIEEKRMKLSNSLILKEF